MELKNLIATSKSAKVYKCNDQAVKVFEPSYSKVDVLLEALNTGRVESTGLHIPTIQEVSKIDGNWAITMNFIEGQTLAQLMAENPDKKEEYITKMVDLQLEIQSKSSPLLTKLKDKLKDQIKGLTDLDDNQRYELLTRLDGMPNHTKVCHGDFNPRNIIVSNDTFYTLDWIHASQGNASADVARSYLLFALKDVETADMYMDIFCKKTNTKKSYVQEWLPIVAAAQLTKKKPEERETLLQWLDVIDFQ